MSQKTCKTSDSINDGPTSLTSGHGTQYHKVGIPNISQKGSKFCSLTNISDIFNGELSKHMLLSYKETGLKIYHDTKHLKTRPTHQRPMQICIHRKGNSPKPVNHCLTLKEGPKKIRKFLAQDFV